MRKRKSPGPRWSFRADVARGFALAILTGLIWCALYDRWSPQSWRTPLTYLSNPEKGDVIGFLAEFKAAADGHIRPLLFTNIPELGAPYVANWDDFPIPEKPIICFTGLLVNIFGLFAAANLAVMLAQILAAVSFYAACRILGGAWIFSLAGGLVFAFSRYAFAHGLHHLPVLYYWHIPLCLVICQWIFREGGIGLRERRFIYAIILAVITGVQNVYYTNMFVQFVLFGGLLQAWRHGWKKLGPPLVIAFAAVGALVVMNLNVFFYHLIYGPNDAAVTRDYKWLEIYGLKLVDLVIPPPDHPFGRFAAWGAGHLHEIILSPGELPPSGYLGILGLAALVWLVVVSLRCVANRTPPPLAAWLILWIFLYAEVGGINGILGTLGFQLFRATTRYSIFILCLVLMEAIRRLTPWENRNKPWAAIVAVFVVGFALWDQTPPLVSAGDIETTAAAVASDRDFTEQMESHLPPQAMVFQMPIMDFPESPAPGVGSYDHFRPYLYAHTLRFSFGSDKGRPRADWRHGLRGLSAAEFVGRLESYGFAALYVNRNGFADRGEGVIQALKQLGRAEMIESDQHDLVCIFLKPSPQPVLPEGL